MDKSDKWFFGVMAAALGFMLILLIVVVTAIVGYALNIWGLPCQMRSNQPQCIAQGWNGGTVHLHDR